MFRLEVKLTSIYDPKVLEHQIQYGLKYLGARSEKENKE